VGGSGKTPFVLALGKLLQEHGVAFDILTRGYGRRDSKIRLVDEKSASDGKLNGATLYGDEPLLLAQKLHVPVIVGPDRYCSGQYAESLFSEAKPAHGLWLHLLDDGFQHRSLARDFDIVIVQPADAANRLLPDGPLRESITSLARADAVVLTEGATLEGLQITKQHVWRVTRRIDLDGLPQPRPTRPLVICAIARPERFISDLNAADIEPIAQSSFADHHNFTAQDVRSILDQARRHNANCILTTEKDMVRLAPFQTEIEKMLPIFTVPLVMELIDPKNAVDIILGTVAERLRCRTTG